MSEQISKILDGPFPEQKGEKLQAIDESLKELRETLKDDEQHEYEHCHHLTVLRFLSTVIHPGCCEDTKGFLDAVSFILEWCAKDFECLHDAEGDVKEAVKRYLWVLVEAKK